MKKSKKMKKIVRVEILEQKGYDFLWVDDGIGPYLWMWDVPEERKAQQVLADQAYGDVLVAGYGLGIVQKYLCENPNVKSVLTVEKYSQVIAACHNHYGKLYGKYDIGDFNTWDKKFPWRKYDCVVGDIWKDIIPEALEDYKKFKASALRHLKPDGKIIARGQEFFEYLIEGITAEELIHFLRNQVLDLTAYIETIMKENRKLRGAK